MRQYPRSQETTGRTLIHLVNLRPEPQRNCTVAIRSSSEPAETKVLHPPADLEPRWRVEREGHHTRVVFDLLDVYAVVVTRKG